MGILGTPLGIKHAPANPPGPINLPGPEVISVQIQSGPSIGTLDTPLGIKHAPANHSGPINRPGPEDIPVQMQLDPPMGIVARPMVMRHAPLADIPEAAAPNVEDPFIHSSDVVGRVRLEVAGLSQISEFFWQEFGCVFFELTDLGDIDWSPLLGRPRAVHVVWVSQRANSTEP